MTTQSDTHCELAWADEAMAMHWIDRYAAGIDAEPQMSRILRCVSAPPSVASETAGPADHAGLVERFRRQIEVAKHYAADEKPKHENALPSVFELQIGHLEDIGNEMIAAISKQRTSEHAGLVEAWRDVLDERKRHVDVEGWTLKHDDEHEGGELAQAAACYAMGDTMIRFTVPDPEFPSRRVNSGRKIWPWANEWWKPSNRRRDLVKAGALIIAEIERLDRKERGNG